MTTYYADSSRPDDSGNGLSWAAAKKTLAAVNSIMSAGDGCYCRGVFSAGFTGTGNKQFFGLGALVIPTTRRTGTAFVGAVNLNGFVVDGWNVGCRIASGGYSYMRINDCIFRDCEAAMEVGSASYGSSIIASNLLVEHCQYGIRHTGGPEDWDYWNITNSTFLDCVYASHADVRIGANSYPYLYNCHVHSGFALHSATSYFLADFNSYDPAVQWYLNGSTYTDLATWKTASSRDASSVSLTADINDPLKRGGGWPLPGASCNMLGVNGAGRSGGQFGNLGYGVQRATLTLSANRNASLWSGAVLSNAQIDGNGDIIPVVVADPWYARTDVIDLGSPAEVFGIDVGTAEEDVSRPLYARIRYGNTPFAKGDASPAWVDYLRYARLAELVAPTYIYRYWQVEVGQT